jgi:osmotically-inducible protein OsmY
MKRTSTAAAIFAALVITVSLPATAQQPQTKDLTPQFASINVNGLRAVEVGGIVVLRGQTENARTAASAAELARSLGYTRVANLIRVTLPPDDEKIERTAERQLATRTLDGCQFQLDSNHGVLQVSGKVMYELQKDVVVSLLRNIDGVREVRSSLER